MFLHCFATRVLAITNVAWYSPALCLIISNERWLSFKIKNTLFFPCWCPGVEKMLLVGRIALLWFWAWHAQTHREVAKAYLEGHTTDSGHRECCNINLTQGFLKNRVYCNWCGQGKQHLCRTEPKEERLQSCVLKGREKNFRSNEEESMEKGASKFKNYAIPWSRASPTFW